MPCSMGAAGLKLTVNRTMQAILATSRKSDDPSEAPYIQKWDPCRFTFTCTLPSAKRRPIELYLDGLSGQTVAVKRWPARESERRLQALRHAGARGLEAAWPEVVLSQRLGRARGKPPRAVCACYGAFRDEHGDVLLVSEYVPGGDLLDLCCSLGQPGPEREKRAWPVILSLLRAVQQLHSWGVAHCGVSLENALRRPEPDSEVVLIDFGKAVASERRLKTSICGDPRYMAPEVWGGSEPWDPFQADFFACGVAAYGLAVGKYPWESTKPEACRRFAHFAKHGLGSLLQQRGITLSPRLCALLRVLLSLSPSVRGELVTAFMA